MTDINESGIEAAARAIYEDGPELSKVAAFGQSTENGWEAQPRQYRELCRAIAQVALRAALQSKKPE